MALRTDREKTAHLLRRFGLGASEVELDYYTKGGYAGAVNTLLACEGAENPGVPLERLMRKDNNNIPMPLLQIWWLIRIASSRQPLIEKMSLFWHDHFATSAQKVTGSMLMYGQVDILRSQAIGNFRNLLTDVCKDPAMLFWLDNQFNVKLKPNENFAREIMELFTLGVGNYSEKDVQEVARAFTGWTIQRRGRQVQKPQGKLPPNVTFAFVRSQHDTGIKEVLGNKGAFDGEDVIGILCGNPRTSLYLTEKIWNWFVYPEPDVKIIEKHAAAFRDAGLDIKSLLRSIMMSPEFVSDKAERAIYKNPVDFCLSTIRQLGVGEEFVMAMGAEGEEYNRQKTIPAVAAQQAMKSMGMDLLFPPDVSGWDGGKAWITTSTMVERIQWADRIFPTTFGDQTGQVRSRKAVFRYPAFSLIASNPTPENLVNQLVSVFDAPIPASVKPNLLAAARKSGATLNQQTANAAANAVSRLIFGYPDFQFS
jgi:uncharacterized protein (DUF1800 family)